ncbi:MAG: 16S rRNA (cytosine(1402)-N(4))-methyltransferase RsmH [Rickettsiales bacterium]|jgi:16S rRNA (cytosine1402-N4)-methyltransferase|nr:16S rRNA (cytosine(1402)-N(4))-methyltransferase RsmH [Rickettsiales bacterium]
MEGRKEHIPVLLKEVLSNLSPRDGDVILDATFGAGGYTKAILDSANCKVIAIDRDEDTLKFAKQMEGDYGDRFGFHNIKFSEAKNYIEDHSLDGIVLDLGVSSMQLDNVARGFSFNGETHLSMTMGKNEIDAFTVVNEYSEKNIADIIYRLGDEVKSRVIAKKIVEYRKKKKIETTKELADIVRSCFGIQKTRIDNATKTFQAIRIFVNDELNELETILEDSIGLLKSGGRLVVVSFHSLEDRIVKNFFGRYGDAKLGKINKYKEEQIKTVFRVMTKRPVIATEEEIDSNRRSRSAKLRSAMRC